MFIEARKNISILNNQSDFEELVKADLQKIEDNPIGKRLIEKIAATSHLILIKYTETESECTPLDPPSISDPGNGSANVIWYARDEQVHVFTDQLQPLEMPNFIILFHEMVHAYHNARGKNAQTNYCDKLVWSNDEEYHTIVGFPSKKPHRQIPKITENTFRMAQGLPCRFGHFSNKMLHTHPVLESHIRTLANVFFKNNILSLDPPPPIRNLSIEDLMPIDGYMFCWNITFTNTMYNQCVLEYYPQNYYPYEILDDQAAIINLSPESTPLPPSIPLGAIYEIKSFSLYRLSKSDAELLKE